MIDFPSIDTARQLDISDLSDHVGIEFVSDWVRIDQSLITSFADLTGDRHWIHTDVARATELRGGTIAHGFLVMTLLPALSYSLFEIVGSPSGLNYGVNALRFTGIVREGSRVRLKLAIVDVTRRQNGTMVTQRFEFEREGEDRPAIVGEWLVLYLDV